MTIFGANVAAIYKPLLSKRDRLTDYTVKWIEEGMAVTGAQYSNALGEVDVARSKFDDVFQTYDLLLSPTVAMTAYPVGSPPAQIADQTIDPFWGYIQFTAIINAVGLPAASVPCGFSSNGLPIGLHIIGKHGGEASVLSASESFEEAQPWFGKRPPYI